MRTIIRNILLLSVAVVVATGCMNDNSLDTPTHNPMEVRLWADVGYSPNLVYTPQSKSRGGATSTSGIIDPATDTIITMGMARIDELHTPSYPDFLNCGEPSLRMVSKGGRVIGLKLGEQPWPQTAEGLGLGNSF